MKTTLRVADATLRVRSRPGESQIRKTQMKRHRKPTPVLRTIRLIVSGRVVKTVKQRITVAQAWRENGVSRPGATDDSLTITRRVARCAKVSITWHATDSIIERKIQRTPANLDAHRRVIRAGIPL